MGTDDDDPFEGLAVTPGFRWVEVRDDRVTSRLRWEQVRIDQPDPEPLTDSPQDANLNERLIRELNQRHADHEANRVPPNPEEPV